jgi:hypothetical protein
MKIRARGSMSADGYVTTPTGWPALTADPAFETYRALGALGALQLVVLPILFVAGMPLTSSVSPRAGLRFVRKRALPGGAVEIVYACEGERARLPGQPDSIRAEPA